MENLTRYLSAIAQRHVMLDRRLIMLHEYLDYEKRLAQKYRIPENSIYRDLLSLSVRANKPHWQRGGRMEKTGCQACREAKAGAEKTCGGIRPCVNGQGRDPVIFIDAIHYSLGTTT